MADSTDAGVGSGPQGLSAIVDMAIPMGLVHHTPERPLFHYTDAGGLLGVLQNRKLWATQFQYLNDTREFIEGEELVNAVAIELRDIPGLSENQRRIRTQFCEHMHRMAFSRLMERTFVACFTELGDDLSQWRAYGGRGGGYSIGIRVRVGSDLTNVVPLVQGKPVLGRALLKVEYDRETSRALATKDLTEAFKRAEAFMIGPMSESLRSASHREAMVQLHKIAGRLVLPIKNNAYAAEQEWRVITTAMHTTKDVVKVRAAATTGLIPYVEIPVADGDALIDLEAIYVGPTQDPERGVASARLLLETLGYDPALVKHSEVPFRG